MWEVASCNCGDIGDVNFVTQYISCFLTLQSTFDYKKLRESCSGCRTRKSCKLSISTDIACLPSITLVLRCSAAAGKNNDSCRDAYVEWKYDELSVSQAICACGWLSWFICVARVQFVDAPFRIFISNPDDVSPLSNLPRVKWENASKSLSIEVHSYRCNNPSGNCYKISYIQHLWSVSGEAVSPVISNVGGLHGCTAD